MSLCHAPYLIQGTVILPPLPRSLTCSKMREADGTAATSKPGYQGKRKAKARVSASDGESDHLHGSESQK